MWQKFMMISVNAILTTLNDISVKEITENETYSSLYRKLCGEFMLVAAASGATLSQDLIDSRFKMLMEAAPKATTSMALDARKNNPTEIETLVGEIARRGAALNIPVPEYARAYKELLRMGVR
jgi:2-dehydropantoate 2-reductase